MTMPKPHQVERTAERIVDRARAMIANPDSMDARRAYMQATFNIDFAAAAIVLLADRAQAVEPFLRLAREVVNPASGERPWHADSRDWMVVFSFAGQSLSLGDLRRAAALSGAQRSELEPQAPDSPKIPSDGGEK